MHPTSFVPTEQQRREFGRHLATTGRVNEYPGVCVCYACATVQKFTGRGGLPAGWQPVEDHRLNARARLARFLGRDDIFARLRRDWLDLAGRAAGFWDALDPDEGGAA